MRKYKNAATEKSRFPDAVCIRDFPFTGVLHTKLFLLSGSQTRLDRVDFVSGASEFVSKGMMNDGAESRRVTIFIVKHYGVIYRL